jgi:hypothetical protein
MTHDLTHDTEARRGSGWSRTSAFFLLAAAVAGATAAAPARAAEEAQPCAVNAPSRALDYWVGEWSVNSAAGGESSTSTVRLLLDQCVVVENWGDGRGHDGENVFGYSQGDRDWRGMFFDNRGHVHVFVSGKVADGTAEFLGPSVGAHGEAVLNRIRLVRLAHDRLEQIWEKSVDNGQTWSRQFRLEYTRRSAPSG